ncbi:DUF3592 domain-containing protein [Corallococcus sicarius]|uniref:DUF3592 domain-containing protein n=1 Tax=Corallococcus sicarius TaxID=2316726 RepID=UPI0013155384|nr:DUF3592 domain-containing protein [Corallococcus sicarius]
MLAVFFMGIPALLLVVTWRRYATTRRFIREGVHVQGTVLSVTPYASDNTELRYTFCLPDGTELHHEYSETDEGWWDLRPGSPVDVTYLPEAPDQSRPAGAGVGLPEALLSTFVALVMMFISVTTLLHKPQRAVDPRSPSLPQYKEQWKAPRAPPAKGPRPLGEY